MISYITRERKKVWKNVSAKKKEYVRVCVCAWVWEEKKHECMDHRRYTVDIPLRKRRASRRTHAHTYSHVVLRLCSFCSFLSPAEAFGMHIFFHSFFFYSNIPLNVTRAQNCVVTAPAISLGTNNNYKSTISFKLLSQRSVKLFFHSLKMRMKLLRESYHLKRVCVPYYCFVFTELNENPAAKKWTWFLLISRNTDVGDSIYSMRFVVEN